MAGGYVTDCVPWEGSYGRYYWMCMVRGGAEGRYATRTDTNTASRYNDLLPGQAGSKREVPCPRESLETETEAKTERQIAAIITQPTNSVSLCVFHPRHP